MGGKQRGISGAAGGAAIAAGSGARYERVVRGASAAGLAAASCRFVLVADGGGRGRGRRARRVAHARGDATAGGAGRRPHDIQAHRRSLHRRHRLRTACAARR